MYWVREREREREKERERESERETELVKDKFITEYTPKRFFSNSTLLM